MEQKHWYVVYTRPWWEKKIERMLEEWYGIEAWCPLKKIRRRWSDRVKLIEEPLFRSYVFVKVADKERGQVLSVDGVVNFVRYQQQPARIRQEDIAEIKAFLKEHSEVEVQGLATGTRIMLNEGVFKNKEGIVKKVEGDKIILELIQLGWQLTASVKPFEAVVGLPEINSGQVMTNNGNRR